MNLNVLPKMTNDRLLSSYNYELPPDLIAQNPVTPRDSSRLLVVDSPTTHHHEVFSDLTRWLQPGDLLVLNNTKVIPARLFGRKATGAPIEMLLLEERGKNQWLALVKPGKRFKIGSQLCFYPTSGPTDDESQLLRAQVIDRDDNTGGRLVSFDLPPEKDFWSVLEKYGHIPFPPYVHESSAQNEQYQTVYAQNPGSVAAPTAGLHFTGELLQRLQDRGVGQTYITLHVGVGTFRPVEVEDITEHLMHQEWIEISSETSRKIEETKAKGGRVIAVGTTAVRALEGTVKELQKCGEQGISSFRGKTNLFIYPGYDWQIVDGLITNFHLPRSSLMMLVSALIGRDRLLSLYNTAIEEKYRFYSFGDAMLILPAARLVP
ncbi:MAG: S-adenosylmethionine:tRNA ribosyltransferase-isomerase [Chroococcopsis gigantea SAG 12.99]|jgi:S-adenosylmethionine:tRNA ribosyltransferase-isomerase|nr:S-adenosylmethionine:tRNA ribosyltransferase-isomerase [Chroococcopsis gigantea SAG 12.99]